MVVNEENNKIFQSCLAKIYQSLVRTNDGKKYFPDMLVVVQYESMDERCQAESIDPNLAACVAPAGLHSGIN